MTKPVSEKPRRLPLLDGLRGMAAIAVVFHHEPGMYGSHGLSRLAWFCCPGCGPATDCMNSMARNGR